MTNNEEIKSCPFEDHGDIGQELLQINMIPFPIKILGQPPDRYQVRCGYCGATGPIEDSQEKAITAWNKRVTGGEILNESGH
jgi:hypothetical protein